MIYIGKYNITKTDGSVSYTELEIYKDRVSDNSVLIRTVETGYHNGGSTVRDTTKEYPLAVLTAFTGEYDPVTDKPVIDIVVLGSILQTFGITLQE